jgi:hypothetical protein
MLRLGKISLVVVMLWETGWAQELLSLSLANNPQVVVSVYNQAQVSERMILGAEREAHRLFGQASIQVTWVNCSAQRKVAGCRGTMPSTGLVMQIVPRALTLADSAFGVAFLGADGSGRYADVFFDSVRRLRAEQTDTSEAEVLGCVMAHEIGHLLLGSNAHSSTGIMQPGWSGPELRNLAMGRLIFTRDQDREIHRRVAAFNEREPGPIALTAAHSDNAATTVSSMRLNRPVRLSLPSAY